LFLRVNKYFYLFLYLFFLSSKRKHKSKNETRKKNLLFFQSLFQREKCHFLNTNTPTKMPPPTTTNKKDHDDEDSSNHLSPQLTALLNQLHSAIILNDDKKVEELCRHPQSQYFVNEIDKDGFAALHRAVRKPEQLPCLLAILKNCSASLNVDVIGLDRESPFFMAVHNDNIKAATALFQAGAKVNIMCGPALNKQETPLHVAVKFGYEEMVMFLLQNKAEINARDGLRQTPLIIAAKNNKPNLVYILLSAGALPAPQDVDGKDALYVASENRHVHCVTLLKTDKKYLNDVMSQVRSELKMAKPTLHSSEQLMQVLAARKQKEEEDEKAAAALLQQQKKNKVEETNSSPVAVVVTDPKKTSTTTQQQKKSCQTCRYSCSRSTNGNSYSRPTHWKETPTLQNTRGSWPRIVLCD
jgi:ankyrin repeat protein